MGPLINNTVGFMLKVYRFLTRSVKIQTDSLLWGFVKSTLQVIDVCVLTSCAQACLCMCLHWINITF